MTPQIKARLLLIATTLLWGCTFTLVKSALTDVSPLLFNLLRFTLATLALAAINHRSLRALTRPQLAAGALTGFFLALGYQFQTLGLAHTTAANSAFVTGLVVVIVPVLTLVPALRPSGSRAPSLGVLGSSLIAFVGLVLLTLPAGGGLTHIQSGDLLTLACAFAFACHLLSLARATRRLPAGAIATVQVAFCTLVMLLTQPLERHPYLHLTLALVITLVVCALFATAAAFTIQSYAQRHLPPTQTVLILILEPVFGALTSILFLHETLTPRALFGAALILAGILLTELLPTTHTTEIPA